MYHFGAESHLGGRVINTLSSHQLPLLEYNFQASEDSDHTVVIAIVHYAYVLKLTLMLKL